MHYEKFSDGSVKCIEEEIPFELPEGWAWCRICSIANFLGGYAYKSNKYISESKNMIIRIGNVKNNKLNPYIAQTCISDEYAIETQGYKICVGDILFTMTGTKGKRDYFFSCLIKDDDIKGTNLFLNQRVGCLRLVDNTKIIAEYLVSVLQTTDILDAIFATETGNVNQGNIGSVATLNLLVPIPPTNEQTKISKKLNKILIYLNKHDVESEELAEIIQNVKAKILNLAIRGQLVPQDSNDEPASALLERIRVEKEELIKAGKIKRDKKESIIFRSEDNSYYEKIGSTINCIDDELPYDIPETWTWVRLENCCRKEIRRGKSPKYIEQSNTLVFAQKCNTKYRGIDISLALCLDENTLKKYPADEFMCNGDIVINSTGTGTLGRVGYYQSYDNLNNLPIVPDSHVTVVRGYTCIQSLYLYLYMKANQPELEKKGEGSTNQKELKPLTLKEMLVPIPPADEQKRICNLIKIIFANLSVLEKSLS